jgi:hypothetical protein
LGILDVLQVSRTGNLLVGMGLALLVAGVLLYDRRRGWPDSRAQIDTVW